MVYGFVETKYTGGYENNFNNPKQIHIENIDQNFKNRESIEDVTVVFCTNNSTKTVVVGWYNHATIYRNRQKYHERQYNIKTTATNAHLLSSKKRDKEIPRARVNTQNIGFGQSNIWYANKPEHRKLVNDILNYINNENYKHQQNIKLNNFEDTKLNDSIKNIKINIVDYKYSPLIKKKQEPLLTTKGQQYFKRDRQVAINALNHASFKCEINMLHQTFNRKKDGLPYMEAHHLIPMAYQDNFKYSLDIEENIVSLCSHCHNEIHYGENSKELITILYNQRKDLLKSKNINIELKELLSYYDI